MPFTKLGETAVTQLKQSMRNIYENYGEAKRRSKILRQSILEKFTWEKTAEKISDRLGS